MALPPPPKKPKKPALADLGDLVVASCDGTTCRLQLEKVLPGERDEVGRFQKLARTLEARAGVERAHLLADLKPPELCVHYDAKAIEKGEVLALMRQAGADVARRYLHKGWFVRGMEAPQCAATIEYALGRVKGVLQASVAYASERLVLEYDSETASLSEIESRVRALGYDLEEPEHGHACCMHHAHGHGPSLEMPLAIGSGVLIALGLAVQYALTPAATPVSAAEHGGAPLAATLLYAGSLVAGGWYAARGALNSLLQLRADIESLMVLAAIGAALLGAWFEGALLLFLFSLGHGLEHRAMDRARRAIEALGKLRPETARVKRGADLVEVPIAEVKRGDRIFVRPGDRVPLDGAIREGQSSLDQAAITGESVPVAKGPGDAVFAGTINCEAALEVEVTKLAGESALARVIDMVAEAEARKSPTQRFTQQLERRFVPVVLVLAPLLSVVLLFMGAGLKDAVLRGISVLVAASPCALAISTPSAVLSAVARAAHGGVLMKGGAHLESLGKADVFAFDKTGTVTVGRPKLVAVSPAEGVDEKLLVATAAGAEALSQHPIAMAVVAGAKERGVAPAAAVGCEAVHGKGIRSTVDGEKVEIGSLAFFPPDEVPAAVKAEVDRLEQGGKTTLVVRRAGRFLGVMGVADTLREEAKGAIAELRRLGVGKTIMLSGDNARVAKAISAECGIEEARAPLMPEGKVQALRELRREGEIAMVGDGVNDAPALAAASVGVAMGGAGSDVALETADVVLMSDDLRRLPFAVGLARASTRIVRQNLVISLGVSAVLVLAAIMNWVGIGQAVVLHEGSTLLVVANALRLLAYRG